MPLGTSVGSHSIAIQLLNFSCGAAEHPILYTVSRNTGIGSHHRDLMSDALQALLERFNVGGYPINLRKVCIGKECNFHKVFSFL